MNTNLTHHMIRKGGRCFQFTADFIQHCLRARMKRKLCATSERKEREKKPGRRDEPKSQGPGRGQSAKKKSPGSIIVVSGA
ncbi:hypothetical protein HNY73_007316 [Argiope bruennichi]|uniref:Uncharacterized protein n=1 Tax=Argiope bruennichi TaxID=94029 RepID=A0A8T0FE39_ARGBR|nr:hypothetical protein HNY73_007316 [Argiope bruennichi]